MNIFKLSPYIAIAVLFMLLVKNCSKAGAQSAEIAALQTANAQLSQDWQTASEALQSLKNTPLRDTFVKIVTVAPEAIVTTKLDTTYIPQIIVKEGKTDTFYKAVPVFKDWFTQDTTFETRDYDLTIKTEAPCKVESLSHQLTTKFKPQIEIKEVTKTNTVFKETPQSFFNLSAGWQAGTTLPDKIAHGPTVEADLNITKHLTISDQYNYNLKTEKPHGVQVSALFKVID